jgi:hypothetical protein
MRTLPDLWSVISSRQWTLILGRDDVLSGTWLPQPRINLLPPSSEWNMRKFKPCGMWRQVAGCVALDVSKDRSADIFRVLDYLVPNMNVLESSGTLESTYLITERHIRKSLNLQNKRWCVYVCVCVCVCMYVCIYIYRYIYTPTSLTDASLL